MNRESQPRHLGCYKDAAGSTLSKQPWDRGRPARIRAIAGGTPAVPGNRYGLWWSETLSGGDRASSSIYAVRCMAGFVAPRYLRAEIAVLSAEQRQPRHSMAPLHS